MTMRVQAMFADSPVTITGPDVEVVDLVIDSRRVRRGSLFAALPGSSRDGHGFIPAAVSAGAAAVLCEREVDTGEATRVVAPSARLALSRAARLFYGDPASALVMVGITGTNGKTTLTHLVEGVLRGAGASVGVIGTLGSRYRDRNGAEHHHDTGLTTPDSIDLVATLRAMLDAGTSAVAMEVSSHALHQHRVGGVSYDVGVFTNLTQDHLDYHGDLDSYFAAKAMLFRERLKPGGRAVLNVDDARVATLLTPEAFGFSLTGDARAKVRCLRGVSRREGIELQAEVVGREVTVRSPLVGGFNVENLLAALAAGVALGHAPEDVARWVGAVSTVPGRLERVSTPQQPLVLVDYAHTPDALVKALAAAREVTPGRLICVFGCGGDRDRTKRAPMGKAAGEGADLVVVTNDNPRSEDPRAIATEIEAGIATSPAAGRHHVELDRRAAIRWAVAQATPQDTVLIAGKGHENYQIVGSERRTFDDRDEARAALSEGGA